MTDPTRIAITIYCSDENEDAADIVLDIALWSHGQCSVAWLKGQDHPQADVYLEGAFRHFYETTVKGGERNGDRCVKMVMRLSRVQ